MSELTAVELMVRHAVATGVVYSYVDNMAKAMRHQTRVVCDLIRGLYAHPRIWRGQQRASGARAKKRRIYRLVARNN